MNKSERESSINSNFNFSLEEFFDLTRPIKPVVMYVDGEVRTSNDTEIYHEIQQTVKMSESLGVAVLPLDITGFRKNKYDVYVPDTIRNEDGYSVPNISDKAIFNWGCKRNAAEVLKTQDSQLKKICEQDVALYRSGFASHGARKIPETYSGRGKIGFVAPVKCFSAYYSGNSTTLGDFVPRWNEKGKLATRDISEVGNWFSTQQEDVNLQSIALPEEADFFRVYLE